MKKYIFSLAFSLLTIAAIAQQNSETRTPGDFTGIRTAVGFEIELTQGSVNEVTVTANADVIPKIATTVENSVLIIDKKGDIDSHDPIVIKITAKDLKMIDLSGGAALKGMNTITSDSLYIVSSGAASVKLDLKNTSVLVKSSGAAETKLSGSTDRLTATMSGASELKAYDLAINCSGASSAHITANKKLSATASGAGEIHYQGTATDVIKNASGAGEIIQRDGSSTAKSGGNDSTSFRVGDYDVNVNYNGDDDDERSDREKIASDDDFEFWDGMDLGVNGFLTSDNQLEMRPGNDFLNLNYAKSYMFGINAWQKNIHIYKNYINLGTGIGATWYHYNFRKSYSLIPDAPYASATLDSIKYVKNRLNMCYVNVPLFLEFNTNNKDGDHSFHFAAGMQFGYNIFNNKLKQKYELNGRTFKNKIKNDFNVNPFRYDIIARVGYGDFTIFGTYSLSTLFEKGKGPVVYPFAAGISLDF
jgi:hypothetical protein